MFLISTEVLITSKTLKILLFLWLVMKILRTYLILSNRWRPHSKLQFRILQSGIRIFFFWKMFLLIWITYALRAESFTSLLTDFHQFINMSIFIQMQNLNLCLDWTLKKTYPSTKSICLFKHNPGSIITRFGI